MNETNTKPAASAGDFHPMPPENPEPPRREWERFFTRTARFSEADCGGVFDGCGVISDADPGL